MLLLVRKIERAKWDRRKSDAIEDTPADAITSCMRTSCDKLSVWRISAEDELPNAILAWVAAGEKLDSMDFVILRGSELNAHGLDAKPSPGGTPVKDMVNCHYDIVDLTYSMLGRVAGIILAVVKEERVERRTKAELREILMSAIAAKRLAPTDLTEKLRLKLFPPQKPEHPF
jgi:hypothetical protein